MTIDEIKRKLESVLSPKRFEHSLGVMDTAINLAEKYGGNVEKAALAGILHDCAREIKGQAVFELCKKYHINVDYITLAQPELCTALWVRLLPPKSMGIEDEDVLKAIECHTTGRENMTLLDKIILLQIT